MVNFALAILAGLLLILVQPRFSFWFLAPIAVTPLLYALSREWRPKYRFLLGYAAGVTYWAGVCYWIHFVASVPGKLGPWMGAVAFCLFCAAKGIHLGLFALGAGILVHRVYALAAIPALWVIVERVPDPFGFMWLHLGNASVGLPVPLRLAPFTGVYGISFLFAMTGGACALMLLRRPREHFWAALVLPLPLLLPSLPAQAPGTQVAAAVQPNIADTNEWTYPMVERMNRSFEELSLRAAVPKEGRRANLILWPEVPAPIYYEDDQGLRERLAGLTRMTRAHLLIGTVAHNEEKAPLNAALMVAPDGHAVGRYDKMLLVPFGEYIPFPFGGLVNKITSEIGDFVPGKRVVTFAMDGETVGAFICYESAFPHLVREFAAKGATVLANLSNDGYFGGGAAREQHLSLVRMRAAENRRWVLRATNDGITGVIDPAGRVVGTAPQYAAVSARFSYDYSHELTFYTRWGDWFAWLCGLGALAGLVVSQFPHYIPESRRPPRKPSPSKLVGQRA